MNFIIHNQIDDKEVKTVLRNDEYGGDDDGSWVALAPAPAAPACLAGSPLPQGSVFSCPPSSPPQQGSSHSGSLNIRFS